MNNEKLGQEPAYPVEVNLHNVEEQFSQNGPHTVMCHGMSKRFYAACVAMQGLLSNPNTAGQIKLSAVDVDAKTANAIVCRTAYEIAEELLKQEQL